MPGGGGPGDMVVDYYPNPVIGNSLIVQVGEIVMEGENLAVQPVSEQENYQLLVSDMYGQVYNQKSTNSSEVYFNVSDLQPGVYRLIVIRESQLVEKLFVRQN